MKAGEGINLRIFMQYPRTWKTMWGLTEGQVGVGLGGGRQRERAETTVIA